MITTAHVRLAQPPGAVCASIVVSAPVMKHSQEFGCARVWCVGFLRTIRCLGVLCSGHNTLQALPDSKASLEATANRPRGTSRNAHIPFNLFRCIHYRKPHSSNWYALGYWILAWAHAKPPTCRSLSTSTDDSPGIVYLQAQVRYAPALGMREQKCAAGKITPSVGSISARCQLRRPWLPACHTVCLHADTHSASLPFACCVPSNKQSSATQFIGKAQIPRLAANSPSGKGFHRHRVAGKQEAQPKRVISQVTSPNKHYLQESSQIAT